MKNRMWMVAAVAVAAIFVAGGLYASNMGFKLNYRLDDSGAAGSLSGTQTIALPYNQQTGIDDAKDLIDDVNASGGTVGSVSNYLSASDSLQTYTGSAGTAFALESGKGYVIKMNTGTDYVIVGSHDPGLGLNLLGPADSASGTTLYSYPYHSTSADAKALIDELNVVQAAVAGSISQYLSASDSLQTYTGTAGVAFALTPGNAYYIKVNDTISYTPSHF